MTDFNQINSSIKSYEDEYGNIHQVDILKPGTELGRGGQGVVYRTEEPNIALKLALQKGNEIENEQDIIVFKDNIKDLLLKQVPFDVNVSIPLSVLKDKAGYVMKLLNTAKSFEKFTNTGIKDLNDYNNAGTLRLRSFALGKAASTLSRLHGMGLVYGDISDKNIFFIPDKDDKCVIWFIDADNIDYDKKSPSIVYTPGFGAPELVQQQDGIRPQSDCFAFSVLLSLVISLAHPFEGKALNQDNSDSDDFFDVDDSLAYSGQLPWIDDPDDRSNEETLKNQGLPRDIIFTKSVHMLLEKTFCKGRIYPAARPSIYHFVRALIQEHDLTIKCQFCNFTLPINPDNIESPYVCRCCDKKSDNQFYFYFKSYRLTARGKSHIPEWFYVREFDIGSDIDIKIPCRVFQPFDNRNFDSNYLEIKKAKDRDFFKISKQPYVEDAKVYIIRKDDQGKIQNVSPNSCIVNMEDLKMSDNFSILTINNYGYARLVNIEIRK